jgi:hypothetical protein
LEDPQLRGGGLLKRIRGSIGAGFIGAGSIGARPLWRQIIEKLKRSIEKQSINKAFI